MISVYGDQRYFGKLEKSKLEDLLWNLPEPPQTLGSLSIVGGNKTNFREEIKTAESALSSNYFSTVTSVFPDSLKNTFSALDKPSSRIAKGNLLQNSSFAKKIEPPSPSKTPEFTFSPSTPSGSFSEFPEPSSDFTLFLGDFSKNSETAAALTSVLVNFTTPALLARDTIDLISTPKSAEILQNPNLIYFTSGASLQNLFRSALYPKPIFLSMPLPAFADALHKFTLTYPAKIVTLFASELIFAESGEIRHFPLTETAYSPISLWSGETALRLIELNLANPNNFLNASAAAIVN